jgi:tetratricopeptide (TPR) repeat protein
MTIKDLSKSEKMLYKKAEGQYKAGNAKFTKKDFAGAIEEYSSAIKEWCLYSEAYYMRGYAKDSLGKYDEAIDDYTKAIIYKRDYSDAYYMRANAKYSLGQYKAAVADYDEAIKMHHKAHGSITLAAKYNNRGNAKCNLCEKDDALEDYNEAIRLDSGYIWAYFNRGALYFESEEWDKAITDFSAVLDKKSSSEKCEESLLAHLYRGIAYLKSSNYQNAINDFTSVINCKTFNFNKSKIEIACEETKLAHLHRGIANYKSKKDEEADEDFCKAKASIYDVLDWINKENEPWIKRYVIEYDEFFNSLKDDCKDCKEKYKELYYKSFEIASLLRIKDNKIRVAHYTTKDASVKLLVEQSPIRLVSINTSNDKEEGKTLTRYLFDAPIQHYAEEYGAFAICFMYNNDNLNQFRLYGKENDKEGTGVSITVNDRFFGKDFTPIVLRTQDSTANKTKIEPLPLFRCVYIDPETNHIESISHIEEYDFIRNGGTPGDYNTYINEVNESLIIIRDELGRLREIVSDLNPEVVAKMLLNLRYLVKNVAFMEEQECRVVQVKKISKSDESIKLFDTTDRLYVDYLKLNNENVEIICFGPKMDKEEIFQQLLVYHGYDAEKLKKSTAPLA